VCLERGPFKGIPYLKWRSLLEMIELLLEPIKVELIGDEEFIDLTEEMMILKITEPFDPSTIRRYTLTLFIHGFELLMFFICSIIKA